MENIYSVFNLYVEFWAEQHIPNFCNIDFFSSFRKLDMAEIEMRVMKNSEHGSVCLRALS